jgi:hypothetical protein
VFIGYSSSFFVALLLGFFYLSYAATGVLAHIRKDVKNEIHQESSDVKIASGNTKEIPVFTIDYVADTTPINQPLRYPEYIAGITFADESIPVKKNFLSDYFLRPPPKC